MTRGATPIMEEFGVGEKENCKLVYVWKNYVDLMSTGVFCSILWVSNVTAPTTIGNKPH